MIDTTTSRIERVLEAHPGLDETAVRLVLCYFYQSEWNRIGSTAEDVQDTLDSITQSLIDGNAEEVNTFVNQITEQNIIDYETFRDVRPEPES